MTKLEASITQLVNKAAIGDLRATKVLMQMASRFPELVKDPESIKVIVEIVEPQASPGANPIAEPS